jgi:hypothetical protein
MEVLKCILGYGSKGRCFLGGALLGPEMEKRMRAHAAAWNA